MIFTSEQISDPAGIFHGWSDGPSNWTSSMPSMSAQDLLALIDFDSTKSIARGARADVYSGMRIAMTGVARAYGYFQTAVSAIDTFFAPLIDDLVVMVKEAVVVAVGIAVGSISWIPIVGWIIGLIWEAAKSVVRIFSAIGAKKDRNEANALAEAVRSGVPFAFPNPEADTMLGRNLLYSIREYDVAWMISPHYNATSVSDFHASRQYVGLEYGARPTDTAADGYLINTDKIGGLGYMPGALNIHSAIQLPTRGARSLTDLGSFLTSTQAVAASVWGQMVQGDSGLIFAVETDKIKPLWTNYVENAAAFAAEKMSRGWSMVRGVTGRYNGAVHVMQAYESDAKRVTEAFDKYPIENADSFICTKEDAGLRRGCRSTRGGKAKVADRNEWRPIQSSGHTSIYTEYLNQLFDWGRINTSKPYSLDNIDWDDIAPNRALDNLRDRQEAMINSVKCMYLDDASVQVEGGSSAQRFRAIRKGTSLHRLWMDNVRALFESGQWDRIDYRDVVKGEEIDQALHDVLSNRGTTPDKFFNMDKPAQRGQGTKSLGIVMDVGPSVLGDPEPPAPPDTKDFERTGRTLFAAPKRPGKKKSGGGLAVAAVAAAALALMSKKG